MQFCVADDVGGIGFVDLWICGFVVCVISFAALHLRHEVFNMVLLLLLLLLLLFAGESQFGFNERLYGPPQGACDKEPMSKETPVQVQERHCVVLCRHTAYPQPS